MNSDNIDGLSLKLSSPMKKTMKNDNIMINSSSISGFGNTANRSEVNGSVMIDKMAARKKEPVTFEAEYQNCA